jgi:hypothetical protein
MYENSTTLRLRPGVMDKVLGILREQILPHIKDQKGLIHIALVPDRTHDRLTVISLWASAREAAVVEKKCAYFRALGSLDPYLRASLDQSEEEPNLMSSLSPKIPLN